MSSTNSTYLDSLASYLPRRRWFAGKGREFTVTHVHALPWLEGRHTPAGHPRSRIELVTVTFDDGTSDTYQLPIAYLARADESLEYALVGSLDDPDVGHPVAYDGVFVKETVEALYDAFLAAERRTGSDSALPLSFHTVEGAELPDVAQDGAVMSAEQSNTSIAYGDEAILKLFRRVSDGRNPDIEIHRALTRAGVENVAPLFGWVQGRWTSVHGDEHSGDLGMLQAFLTTATDGWDLALASVRDLFGEEDLHPSEVGGDFAGESERLGEAVAGIHAELRRLFPTGSQHGGAELASAMTARLDAALDVVPALAEFSAGLRARYERLHERQRAIPTQRVHGDLHLGQTLRTVKGWKIIDFEGEPAKSLAERTVPSSPLQDVAGMLRSFDYAAGASLQNFGTNPQLAYRAHEWSERNCAAFRSGYLSVAGEQLEEEADLVEAFEADKAVYEAVYETRNRPTWVEIPLHAIARITAEE
jgi:maltokinase